LNPFDGRVKTSTFKVDELKGKEIEIRVDELFND